MSYIQKSKIKAFINSNGVRVSPDAFDGINRQIEALMEQMIAKVEADGMKTLMSQHTSINKVTNEKSSGCKKCANIKPEFLKFARNTQGYCHDQAYKLSKEL